MMQLEVWCKDNNVSVYVTKTTVMIIDVRGMLVSHTALQYITVEDNIMCRTDTTVHWPIDIT